MLSDDSMSSIDNMMLSDNILSFDNMLLVNDMMLSDNMLSYIFCCFENFTQSFS
jgi:hypothetical protein